MSCNIFFDKYKSKDEKNTILAQNASLYCKFSMLSFDSVILKKHFLPQKKKFEGMQMI